MWHDSRCLSGYSLSTTCLAEQAGRPTGTSVISAGTGPGRATWRPWTVIVPAVASLMAAILLGTLGFFAVGFGMGTMCTDFADTKSTDHCQTLTRWLTAGQVGQGLCAITAVVLLVLAPRRPQNRRTMAACGAGLLILTLAVFACTSYGGYRSYH